MFVPLVKIFGLTLVLLVAMGVTGFIASIL